MEEESTSKETADLITKDTTDLIAKEKQETICSENKEVFCYSYSKEKPIKHYSDSEIIKEILYEFSLNSGYEEFLKNIGYISSFKFKRFESYNTSTYFTLIQDLSKKILASENGKPSFPQNLESKIIHNKLILNYQTLSQIVDYLLFLLNRAIQQKKEDEITSFLNKGSISSQFGVKVNEKELKIDFFWKVQVLEIKLSESLNSDLINLDKIIFFEICYNTLFPNINTISFDLNINKLNEIYLDDDSPYKMRKNSIENISKNFSNCIIGNYILLYKLCQKSKKKKFNFHIKLNDDYIKEIETVFWSQIETLTIPKPSKEKTHLLLYSHLYSLNKLHFLDCSINALDKLLFNIVLIMIFRNNDLTGFSIKLFPNEINKRKMLLNNLIFDKKDEESIDNIYKHYDILHKEKYDWQHKDNNIIKDEFILDLLFDDFSLNLIRLSVVIQKKCKVQVMKLNCILPEELREKLNYSYAIGYFIFNLFNIFLLKVFQIKFDLLEVTSNVNLPDLFFQKPIIPINISNLTINQMVINLKNLSKFINLDYLPQSLTSLTMTSIGFEDLCKLAQGISKKKYELEKLREIIIEVNYTKTENYDEPLKQLLLALPDNLYKFTYKMKTYIDDTLIVNSINYLIKLQNVEDVFYANFDFFLPELDEEEEDELKAWFYINTLKQKIRKGADSSQKNWFKFFFNNNVKNQLSIVIFKYSISNNMMKQYHWLDQLITNINRKHNTSNENSSNMLIIYSILGLLNIPYQKLFIKFVFNKEF